VVGVFVALFATVAGWYFSAHFSKRAETEERQRLSREVLGQVIQFTANTSLEALSAGEPPAGESPAGQPPAGEPPAGQPPAGEPPAGQPPAGQPPAGEPTARQPPAAGESPSEDHVASRDTVYDQLLINDYALGLTQARRAFNVSISFSILGGIVLVLGVALAIFRADTGGEVAGAAITSAAGVLTSGLSQLFRGQSTKALKHLEAQAVELRKDVRAQINVATAQRLLGEVSDTELRSHLQAALILEFTGAKLPDFARSSQFQPGALNGNAQSADGAEPAVVAAE
jgi:TRADD-N domain-containing protein